MGRPPRALWSLENLVPLDREDTLKKAEKLLRQGRLDSAIAEYLRVVEDQPRDWNTANTLGDLYARANQPAKAVAQYARIAEHFFQDGFYPRAAAIYKKILKLVPDEESAQLKLADISVRLGLLKDAKTYYGAVAARRRTRGDARGSDEIVILLGTVDPADFGARAAAARVRAGEGDEAGAAAKFRELHADLLEKGREPEALEALREAVRLNPGDTEGRTTLAKAALASGDLEGARGYLDREAAGKDPALLNALIEVELGAGGFAAAASLLTDMLKEAPERRDEILGYAWRIAPSDADAAFTVVDAAADALIAATEFDRAAGVLQSFVGHAPAHVPALLKLVEVCVDGGLETAMYETQAQLTDAYLASSQAAEARVIAEDLVAREPWEAAHIERFRRALVMLRVPEPDSVIAERLSGQTPFVATDHFWDGIGGDAPAAAPPPVPAAAAPPAPAAAPPAAPPPDAPRDAMEIDSDDDARGPAWRGGAGGRGGDAAREGDSGRGFRRPPRRPHAQGSRRSVGAADDDRPDLPRHGHVGGGDQGADDGVARAAAALRSRPAAGPALSRAGGSRARHRVDGAGGPGAGADRGRRARAALRSGGGARRGRGGLAGAGRSARAPVGGRRVP